MTRALRIVVCVRPAEPDSPDASLGSMDLGAIEYAVRLARRSNPAGHVTALALGGDEAVKILRECTARGVDETVHARAEGAPRDGLVTARLLATVVRDQVTDLVLCGTRSDAGMHGTVARELAWYLDLPYVGSVVELGIEDAARPVARIVQRLERGDRWTWEAALPVACGVERDICAPRYLAVRRARRAAARQPVSVDLTPLLGSILEEIATIGTLAVEGRVPPRIRPKKATVATTAMPAADRMKLLRGGGKARAAGGGDDEKPKRFNGDPRAAAVEIVSLLEKKDLLKH